MINNQNIQLTIDDLNQLSKSTGGSERSQQEHCFWSIYMPDPNTRPKYYESITKIYRDYLDPPLTYVDAYHPSMGGSPIFNEDIQKRLIAKADYMVVDLSCLRHNILFEGGFGIGSGMQVIFYVDLKSPVAKKLANPIQSSSLKEIKEFFPSQIQYAVFAQPERSIPIINDNIRSPRIKWDKISEWFQKHVHDPGTSIRRRKCCKIHVGNVDCAFEQQLNMLLTQKKQYFYSKYQTNHMDQDVFTRTYFEKNGFIPVEEEGGIIENESDLCRTCFNVKLAKRIVVDGTSPDEYRKESAEAAFILGMAVAKLRSSALVNVKLKMLYEEKIGPIGMYVGAKAGWESERWADQIKRELDVML